MLIDTDKYEGHTPAPWCFRHGLDLENETHAVVSLYDDPRLRIGGHADMQLIADAPKLLAEVKRLREGLQEMLNVFETNNTSRETMRNRIETILKGDD